MRTWMVLSLLIAVGCGGGSKKTAEPAPDDGLADRAGTEGACVKLMQKQRSCTDAFIPALVGWRVELDVPAGIAATDASEGRDALVAKAKEEWAASNSDEQLATLCTSIVASIPDDQLGPMSEIGDRCAATATCDEYVTCIEPMQRQRLEAQKAQAGAPAAE